MDLQYFKNLLHDRNLKATSTRLSLLSTMHEYETAIPYSVIQKSMQSIDRVTIYRTLESLKEQGIIHKAYQENNEVYYAICGTKCETGEHNHDHIHFMCNECKSVTCEETKGNVKISLPDYEVNKVSIYLEGVCKACR